MNPTLPGSEARAIVFFDGDCGFCHHTMLLIARRDKNHRFLLMSNTASLLSAWGFDSEYPRLATQVRSTLVVRTPDGRYLQRATAVSYILGHLTIGFLPDWMARVAGWRLFDHLYDFVARRRRRIVRRCVLPDPTLRAHFINK